MYSDASRGLLLAAPALARSHDVALLIAFVLMALALSFLCSVAEAVLLSVTPAYIEAQKERRPRHSSLLKRLRQDSLDRSLSAILTLNTIAHTVGAIGAGAKAAVVFGSNWVGLFSAAMTLMILFLSEIVPKTIGAVHWERLAAPISLFVHALTVVLRPLVFVSERLTQCITRGQRVDSFNRDELIAMASVGTRTGQIDDGEWRIIRNLFLLRTLSVADIMTPRTVVAALPEEITVQDALNQVVRQAFSRLPVYRATIDDITGFVLKDDVLLSNALGRGGETLESLRREVLTIPDTLSLARMLERFIKERQQIAVVCDEYGGTKGLVTLEDLVETLIGVEIVDEGDEVEDLRALARRLWAERAKSLGISGRVTEGNRMAADDVPLYDSAEA